MGQLGDACRARAAECTLAARAADQMSSRRFPPPWSVEETDDCFIVRDQNGQALACARRPSCSPAMRPGASPPTSPSCRSCWAERLRSFWCVFHWPGGLYGTIIAPAPASASTHAQASAPPQLVPGSFSRRAAARFNHMCACTLSCGTPDRTSARGSTGRRRFPGRQPGSWGGGERHPASLSSRRSSRRSPRSASG